MGAAKATSSMKKIQSTISVCARNRSIGLARESFPMKGSSMLGLGHAGGVGFAITRLTSPNALATSS